MVCHNFASAGPEIELETITSNILKRLVVPKTLSVRLEIPGPTIAKEMKQRSTDSQKWESLSAGATAAYRTGARGVPAAGWRSGTRVAESCAFHWCSCLRYAPFVDRSCEKKKRAEKRQLPTVDEWNIGMAAQEENSC